MLRFHLPTIRIHKIKETKDITCWRWGRKTFENLCRDSSEFWEWIYLKMQLYLYWNIYLNNSMSSTETLALPYSFLFLVSVIRNWKQSRSPSADDWIMKMWHVYTMKYYSAIKENENMKFADRWLELKKIILSEVI